MARTPIRPASSLARIMEAVDALAAGRTSAVPLGWFRYRNSLPGGFRPFFLAGVEVSARNGAIRILRFDLTPSSRPNPPRLTAQVEVVFPRYVSVTGIVPVDPPTGLDFSGLDFAPGIARLRERITELFPA